MAGRIAPGARVGVVGSGIAGLAACRALHADHDVTLFERESRLGGHTHTLRVDEDGREIRIDSGFMVFNHITYPNLVRFFRELEIPSKPAPMSFSVQHGPTGLEYRGTNLDSLFAQRRNLLSPRFWRLLLAINRFNGDAARAIETGEARPLTLGQYAEARGYGRDFLDLYILPLSGAIWSATPRRMADFPAETLLRFFHNHGFLGLHTHHPWYTVDGGASTYVDRLERAFAGRVRRAPAATAVRRTANGVVVTSSDGVEAAFDAIVLACHGDEAQALLGPHLPYEAGLVAPFTYSRNTVLLHTDDAVMPRTRHAWASWNARLDAATSGAIGGATGTAIGTAEGACTIHYWMNNLQGVSNRRDYFVSLNAEHLIDESRILRRLVYTHPVFDHAAVAAQRALRDWNASSRDLFFAGSYLRYGFHEDALVSSLSVCETLTGRTLLEETPA